MPSPFALLLAWIEATGNPTMPGLAWAEERAAEPDSDPAGWPDEGEPHPLACRCPDCAGGDSPAMTTEQA